MSNAIITVGLGFGDEGKGATIDALARQFHSKLVVRYTGGAQALHNVVTPEGIRHGFSQFSSAFLIKERTDSLLADGMLVNPLDMLMEAEILVKKGVPDPLKRSFIHENCLMITPFHIGLNRLRERLRTLSTTPRHGSCGKGVGETRRYALENPEKEIRIGHLRQPRILKALLEACHFSLLGKAKELLGDNTDPSDVAEEMAFFDWPINELCARYAAFVPQVNIVNYEQVSAMFKAQKTPILFESAQGVLLDESHGFHPYTTWTNTTMDYAYGLLDMLGFKEKIETIGIIRALPTRHGAGPFPTCNEDFTKAFQDEGNPDNAYQGGLRVGLPDLVLLRYALEAIGGVDYLAVNHFDQIRYKDEVLVATRYAINGRRYMLSPAMYPTDPDEEVTKVLQSMVPDYESFAVADLLPLLSAISQAPIGIIGSGPTAEDRTILLV